MKNLGWFLAALAAGLLLALWAVQPPSPRGADAPADAFSAERAFADVEAMARAPHPTGSAENRRVRDHLVRRLTDLGLEVSIQRASVVRAREPGWAAGAWVENIVAVLPGRDRSGPAVVLMSHYDSVAGSPGAADDAAGVAASLEAVRALLASEAPRERDLIVLITDAEEQGLLGAQAFFERHPLRERAAVVVNLEARGSAGRAFMFETGPDNGEAVELYARAVGQPSATSLATFLYSVLPNDTDFSHPRDLGVQGFNLAFIGEPYHYHSATSTPAELDRGSLQHLGSQALDLTRALVTTAQLPGAAPDRVFADLFGLATVSYPVWAGWLPLVLTGLILVGITLTADRAAGARARGIGAGVLAGLLTLALALALARLSLIGTGVPAGFVEARPLMARLGWLETALFAAGLASALLVGAWLLRGRGPTERRWELPALGLLGLGWLIGLGLQILAPEAAPVAAWPAAIGAIAALLARRLGQPGLIAASVLGALGAGFMLALAHGVFLGVGWTWPEGPAAFTLLTLLPLAALWARASGRWSAIAGVLALLAAGACVAWLRLGPQVTAERPGFAQVLHVADTTTGAHVRASAFAEADAWTREALGEGITRADLPAIWAEDAWVAPTAAVPVPEVPVGVERFSDGRRGVRVMPGAQVRELRLTLESEGALPALTLNGVEIEPPAAGEPIRIRWSAPQAGVSVILGPTEGPVTLRWAAVIDGWPEGAEPLPPRPATVAPWGASGSFYVTGERRLD